MAVYVQSFLSWLRRTFAWSNSWQSWQERLTILFAVAAAGSLWWFGNHFTLAQLVGLWGILLIVLAVFLRRGWLKLFGPVLFYDMMITGRRTRNIVFRIVYACLLTSVLLLVYLMWMLSNDRPFSEFIFGSRIGSNEMALFAEIFFYTFMLIQFCAVVLLTPGYTAGAIATEKECGTLQYLLATDLRNREIVLSKLASRVFNLVFFMMTGLPILSMLQMMGGVDPQLVLAGFAATGITILSLAGLSIFFSVILRKPFDAIVVTYLAALAYVIPSLLAFLTLLVGKYAGFGGEISAFPASGLYTFGITVQDVVDWLNSGNIIAIVIHIFESGGALSEGELGEMLRGYALFHGIVFAVCVGSAVLLLRRYAMQQAQITKRRFRLIPRVGPLPMLWKEIFIEHGPMRHWIVTLFVVMLVLVSFVPLTISCCLLVDQFLKGELTEMDLQIYQSVMNAFHVRTCGTAVACLLLLAVAVRAAGAVRTEQDRQTIDSLLTSPMDSDNILFSKWVGSIVSVRWGWLWLGAIYGTGVMYGAMHFTALPFVMLAWFVFAAFAASLGTWYSVVCKSTLRAIMWTLLTIVALTFGHWILFGCPLIVVSAIVGRDSDVMAWVLGFELLGMTPVGTIAWLGYHGGEFTRLDSDFAWRPVVGGIPSLVLCLTGLFCWGVVAIVLYGLASERFRRLAGRTARRWPERSPMPLPKRPVPKPLASAIPDGTRASLEEGDAWVKRAGVWNVEADTPAAVADADIMEAIAAEPFNEPIVKPRPQS